MGKVELLGGRAAASRTSKALCVITAGVAFVLGIVVGVLVPLYVLPPLHGSAKVARPLPPHAGVQHQSVRVGDGDRAEMLVRRLPAQAAPRQPAMPDMERVAVIDVSDEEELSLQPPPGADTVVKDVSEAQNVSAPVGVELVAAEEVREEVSVETHHAEDSNSSVSEDENEEEEDPDSLTSGIFWSEAVEAAIPAGFSERSVEEWRDFCRHSALIKVEEGCGRMQNRLITFENGTRSCCRYRQNFDQIQGDIFSFFLSRLLGIRNVAPTSLMLVRPADWQWSAVRSQLSLAEWAADRPVVLTRFQENLEPAYVPEPLRRSERRLHPTDLTLRGMSLDTDKAALVELAQWSDLVVFDYLTANLDRVVNNLYNQQWNPSMMEAPAHNLARDPATGLLLFLDNESGLLHGYRLLDKYEGYHRTMLDATCVFRRGTVEMVRRLRGDGNVGQLLRHTFRQMHPEMSHYLPTLPEKSIRILNERIANVHEVMERCERTYGSR